MTVAYGYDSINNLTSQTITVDSTTRTMLYTYDDDNRITQVQDGSSVKSYVYDTYGRLTDRNMLYATLLPINQTYEYLDDDTGTRSNRVGSLTTTINNSAYQTQTYTYDANGNITSVTIGDDYIRYTYDAANQLIREDNQAEGKTWVYTYDLAGNITRKETYSYTLADGLGANNPSATTYTYGDSAWGDLLTGYGNYTINSDNIGNPLEVVLGDTVIRSYSWEHGRQLASLTEDGTTWNYTYNTAGLRTERSNGTKTYTYVYNGSQLTYMTVDGHTLWFSYDAHGPMYVKYDGTTYLYVTNLQGDVIAIVNNSGNAVVEYTYDAWGNILSTSGSLKNTLGVYNPLRYRGYVYDSETTLYYLQSRYYDPKVGRFINADALVSTGQGLLGNNMFAYCNNNPVSRTDYTGSNFRSAFSTICLESSGGTIIDYVIYYLHPNSKKNLETDAKLNHSETSSIFVEAGSFDELVAALNNVPGYVDDVFIYMHGDETELCFYEAQYYSAEDIEESLCEIDIGGYIYFFSCKGGRGKLASTMANATNCTVIASVYKVSFDPGIARCGWANYIRDINKHGACTWYSFYPDGRKEPLSNYVIITQ